MTKMDEMLKKIRQWTHPWETGASPMEVRRAILEEVESRAVALGEGRKVFPFNRLQVQLLADDAAQRAEIEAVAREGWHLETEIRDRLRVLGCQVPARMDVEIAVFEGGASGGPDFGERRFAIVYERAEAPAGPDPGRPTLELTVVQGQAAQKVHQLSADRIYLGRLREVLDVDSRVKRRNDVAFLEQGEVNQTVSREHARIVWDRESGGYWLRAEPGASGTRIFRDGRSIDVSAHDRRGVRLQAGDEVYLGRACLKVGFRPPA